MVYDWGSHPHFQEEQENRYGRHSVALDEETRSGKAWAQAQGTVGGANRAATGGESPSCASEHRVSSGPLDRRTNHGHERNGTAQEAPVSEMRPALRAPSSAGSALERDARGQEDCPQGAEEGEKEAGVVIEAEPASDNRDEPASREQMHPRVPTRPLSRGRGRGNPSGGSGRWSAY